ncbi:MAG: HAD-IC family P-type ATPase [Propionibacteriaceae bacterium]|jgi:magnesium-transporting ATPase (P-type)|nr:HAD-IC family P-type ATPase [Propionibacteriaceae bacterium]
MNTTAVPGNERSEYSQPVDDVLVALRTTATGLTSDDAAARRRQNGPNHLPEPQRDHPALRFLKHFDDILIYILLAAAALKAALGEWVDFGVIIAVVFINAAIGSIQEGRAEHALAGIRSLLSARAQVRRDGEWTEIPAEDLVTGDIVRVGPGARIPADLRLIEANNLRAEESALTGEAQPVTKTTDPVAPGTGIGDRTSMLFSSAIVAAGSGVGVVTATGAHAEIGRITTLLAQIDVFDTPLTRQISRFGKLLALLIAGMVVVMALIGKLAHQLPFADLISAVIGFAVAAIPEGLPALVTITLALGVQQMARRRAIIRRLPAVETLGAVTRVCSDKTGTLTTNEMTVRRVVTAAETYEVTGLGYAPHGTLTRDGEPVIPADARDLSALIRAAALATDAVIAESDQGWTLVGEPTEGALRTLALKAGIDTTADARLAVVPFDSEHKYSAALAARNGETLIAVVGAPDRLLDRCTVQGPARLTDGGNPPPAGPAPLPAANATPLDRAWWEARIAGQSAQGLRVLGAAYKAVPPGTTTLTHDDLTDLTFAGLAAIVDPPRPEAIAAIATCRSAGIAVTMITGDHAGTAQAIAEEMGILDHTDPEEIPVVTGAELESATDQRLRHLVRHTRVFARTSPEHKLRLVGALQKNGEIVAMTGDGVNDAPALKRADVGVAMGIKGTEATKEAAEIVLADDNFATIEYAVEEGRRIHDNLHKSVLFLLPTNGAQALVVLVAVVFGLTLPLAPVQILWVNMVTTVTLALALAYEPAEPDIMTRPPRRPGAGLVGVRDLPRIAAASLAIAAATLLAFTLARHLGLGLATAQTWAVNTLALAQAAYLFNARFLRESSLRREALTGNRVVWVVVGLLVALQAVFVYVPVFHTWFHSAALDWDGWLVPLGFALAIFAVMEVVKVGLRPRGPNE